MEEMNDVMNQTVVDAVVDEVVSSTDALAEVPTEIVTQTVGTVGQEHKALKTGALIAAGLTATVITWEKGVKPAAKFVGGKIKNWWSKRKNVKKKTDSNSPSVEAEYTVHSDSDE